MESLPDIDNGVVCGDCYDRYALIRISTHRTCRVYCESLGFECLHAFEDSLNSCTIQSNHDCDTHFDWTSDALCQCNHGTATTGISI